MGGFGLLVELHRKGSVRNLQTRLVLIRMEKVAINLELCPPTMQEHSLYQHHIVVLVVIVARCICWEQFDNIWILTWVTLQAAKGSKSTFTVRAPKIKS